MIIIFFVFIFLIIGFLMVSFIYFISPSLSPIPFFPTNPKDLPLIIKTIVSNQQYDAIVDLGAGTGTVIFAAAHEAHRQNRAARFLAVEIHPLLVIIMHLRRLFHPYKKNIRIIRGNILTMDYRRFTDDKVRSVLIYLYVGHRVIGQLKKKLAQLPAKTRIASYMYDIPGWEDKKIKTEKGIHPLFLYAIKSHAVGAK